MGTGGETLNPSEVATTHLAKGQRGRARGATTPHMLCGSPEPQEQPSQELPGSDWGLMGPSAK